MAKRTPPRRVETAEEGLSITFDFSKVPLFDLMDMVELSAEAEADPEKPVDAISYARFMRLVRQCFVKSSRELTGNDLEILFASFWQSFGEMRAAKN